MQLRQTEQSEPVYDAETVRRTLARAAEIEAQQTEAALTAEQIETLSRELGLSPDAVRRSLGELKTAPVPALQAATTAARGLIAPALYGAYMAWPYLIAAGQVQFPAIPALFYCVGVLFLCAIPSLLSWWIGLREKDGRQVILRGFAVGLLSATGIVFSGVPSELLSSTLAATCASLTFIFCVGFALLGAWWRERCEGRYLSVPDR